MVMAAVKIAAAILLGLNIIVPTFVLGVVINSWYLNEPAAVHTSIVNMQWKSDIDKAFKANCDVNANKMASRALDKYLIDTPPLEFLSIMKPVAHMAGLNLNGFEGGEDNRNWTYSAITRSSFWFNGVTYGHGSLTVPAAGVYHITSHVKFYVEDNRKNNNSSQTFHHQIVRYSASSRKQVVLFENVVTECREGINDGAYFVYPSLTGGLAQLDAGDHVIVRVSLLGFLCHERVRDWHYFDMHLI